MGSADVGVKKGEPADVVGCVDAEGEDGGDGKGIGEEIFKSELPPLLFAPLLSRPGDLGVKDVDTLAGQVCVVALATLSNHTQSPPLAGRTQIGGIKEGQSVKKRWWRRKNMRKRMNPSCPDPSSQTLCTHWEKEPFAFSYL